MNSENPRQIAISIETTGLPVEDGHRIIELAAVEMIGGAATYRAYCTYLNPERPIDEAAEAVHGISEELLEGAPTFGEIAPELAGFLNGAELIVHNAPFDIGFLDAELTQAGQESVKQLCARVISTLEMARRLRPNKKNDLDTLIRDLAVEMPKRTLRGSELDAHLIGMVYQELMGGSPTL